MKEKLDWHSAAVVNIYDEASLWSAPFVRLMLEHIPMARGANVLDIGFGTGVPLIELAQRFGEPSSIYGIDLWKAAIDRTREKISVLGVDNIRIFDQSAEHIPLPDSSIDLICSNLGVNNFDNKYTVLEECHRVLNAHGRLCITTNPTGTFNELFNLFDQVLKELKLNDSLTQLTDYINHRETLTSMQASFSAHGFSVEKIVEDETFMRFVNGKALFNHGLMRIGFLSGWEGFVPAASRDVFFTRVAELIESHIDAHGAFSLSIPMVYMEFKKL